MVPLPPLFIAEVDSRYGLHMNRAAFLNKVNRLVKPPNMLLLLIHVLVWRGYPFCLHG